MLLITGHLGFVGSHLCKELKKRGIPYVGYDLQNGDDIRDIQNMDCVFEREQIDSVIHLAALAGVRRSKDYPNEYISTNIEGTLNVVRLCEKYKIRHLINYSSSSIFGIRPEKYHPSSPFEEVSDKNPYSLYGITKLAAEKIVMRANITQKTTIRPFTVYGENGRKDEVIYKWLTQIKEGKPITVYGDGSSVRGYVYVKDLVNATCDILQKKAGSWKYEDFNLGGSEVIELRDIVRAFMKHFKGDIATKTLDLPKEDKPYSVANTSKARLELDFRPEKRFFDNLKKILKNN